MKRAAAVLLVEDDRSMLHGMRDLLQAADIGYDIDVSIAGDGQAALESISEHAPDLIVSDIMMPRMDGYQLLDRVRQDPAWVHIPFIFLTAKGDKREVFEGRKSAADLYIVKPFGSDQLLELVESQLSKHFRSQIVHQRSVSELKKSILQVLNHEFRTPLTYVNAYYEMLAEGVSKLSGEQNLQEYLRGIQAGSVRLSGLVNDLIQVMELRTGETEAEFLEHAAKLDDIGALLRHVVEPAREEAERQGVHLHYIEAADLPPVFGHAESLNNILARLLSNAIKFTRHQQSSDATVTLLATAFGGEVHISVQDTGSGFPEGVRSRLFDLFFQYNRGLLEQQGAGLGLTIAKGLAELHNGRIEVESEEGIGSRFTLVLPSTATEPVVVGRNSESQRPATILIVEDDPHLLEGLKELLEVTTNKYEYTVFTAANGEEGLDVLSRNIPDLIISDIMMPRMGGYELLRNVRNNPDWFQIPFVFLTARGDHREIHKGLVSGVEEYITKPYQSHELLELIATQLDRHFHRQGVLAQSFEGLKRSIIDLITPEFRLPLTSVSQFSDQLADDFQEAQTESDLTQSLQGIHEGSLRLTRLVEDFITLAELRTGEAFAAHELREQPIGNLGSLLCEAGRLSSLRPGLAHLRVHCSAPDHVPPVLGASDTISESIQRIIEVGVKLLPGGCDEVFLTLTYSTQEVHIHIHIPAMPQPEILDQLGSILEAQGGESPDSSYHAPGIRIAAGLLALQKGRIEMDASEGTGWLFKVILPLHQSSA